MLELVEAWKRVAQRHEVLRMRFGSDEEGQAFQRAVDALEWDLPVREVTVGTWKDASSVVASEEQSEIELTEGSMRLLIVHVGTENVAAMAAPVLRHRIIPNFSATSEGLTSDDIIERIVEEVPQKEKLNS